MTIIRHTIDLAEAQRVIDAGRARAQELGIAVAIYVVDPAAQPVALQRMDGSLHFATRIALGKATTAVGMNAPTEVWEQLTADSPGFAGGITSVEGFVPFSGGIPLTASGELIGAVGVSGGTPDQDVDVARAATRALGA
jgi:uncharacterized protein GlcG (DUF336 family)